MAKLFKNELFSYVLVCFVVAFQICNAIFYEEDKVSINLRPVATKGENVEISCEYDIQVDAPYYTVTFWKSSKLLMKIKFHKSDNYNFGSAFGASDNVRFVKKDSSKVDILLTSVTKDDSGDYTCSVFPFGDSIYNSKVKFLHVIDLPTIKMSEHVYNPSFPVQEDNEVHKPEISRIPTNINIDSINSGGLWPLLETRTRNIAKMSNTDNNNNEPSTVHFIFPGQVTVQNFFINHNYPEEQRFSTQRPPIPEFYYRDYNNEQFTPYVKEKLTTYELPIIAILSNDNSRNSFSDLMEYEIVQMPEQDQIKEIYRNKDSDMHDLISINVEKIDTTKINDEIEDLLSVFTTNPEADVSTESDSLESNDDLEENKTDETATVNYADAASDNEEISVNPVASEESREESTTQSNDDSSSNNDSTESENLDTFIYSDLFNEYLSGFPQDSYEIW